MGPKRYVQKAGLRAGVELWQERQQSSCLPHPALPVCPFTSRVVRTNVLLSDI